MNDEFYFAVSSIQNRSFLNAIKPILNDLDDGPRFYINISRAMTYESYIPRQGEWASPWNVKVAPGFEMPKYDPTFSMSFEEVCDARASELASEIDKENKKFLIYYSGGIDSTTAVVSVLKNLNQRQLENIAVAMSADSIVENPNFYHNFIKDKIKVVDSVNHDVADHNRNGYVCVVSDLGDGIFGTELGTRMYPQIYQLGRDNGIKDSELADLYKNLSNEQYHYSRYRSIIISYLDGMLKKKYQGYSDKDKDFGELYYERLVRNINTSEVPINSLHDFFWWIIFNPKFMHCAMRPGTMNSFGDDRTGIFNGGMQHFYGGDNFQWWSMVNNNNGQKIRGTTQGSYKYAAKKYILDYTKDSWYFKYKIKFASMPLVVTRKYKENFKKIDPIFAMNSDYQIVYAGDPVVDNYIRERILDYKITW